MSHKHVVVIAASLAALAGAVYAHRVLLSGPAPEASLPATENVREAIPAQSSVEVRYIANEGVLISSRDKRVLIDGLHRKYGDEYAYLPDTEREKIESAKAPFDAIDLILVSHFHGDHFHPESVGRYLVSNPKASLATSQQVVDEVATKFGLYPSIKERVKPIAFVLKQRETLKVGGLDVEFLGVGHGSGRHASIQNLGHIFSLGGKKFLHIGDASPTPEIFDHFDLDKQAIDIAFLPAWFLTSTEGRLIIRDHIKPKHIIAVHVGPGEGESLKAQIANEFPKADVFGTMLEKRVF
jgi:L-ascorbate metabolism protein UlaG (beta-lactamase superfamily)